jgi:Rieske Fe-S protein
MKEQAQFHPLKYLKKLAEDFIAAGGAIFENTTAVDIEEGDTPTVMTRDGHRVSCKYLIMASHFPFYDKKGLYFTRMYAERSYAIGIKAKKDYPGGMYLSVDEPSRSLRFTPVNGEPLVIVGGESHQTGQGPDTLLHYLALESFADVHFGIKEYKYRWSTQDLITIDKLPYIGEITADNPRILTATGFRKWGMTNGTTAARLLSDMILEKENPYQKLFSPTRHFKADPTIKKLFTINADVAGHLLKGKLEYVGKDADDLHNDEGAVVMVNGKRAGAYKDTDGVLHIVDTTCTHLGCECEWNHGERTWDCPCHGSRYSIDGEVLEGPTHKPLKKIDF